jgi:hypothetical protein
MGNRLAKLEPDDFIRPTIPNFSQNNADHEDTSLSLKCKSDQNHQHDDNDDDELSLLVQKALENVDADDLEFPRIVLHSAPNTTESSESIRVYKPEKLNLFLGQGIDQIREASNGLFKDPTFSSSIKCITENPEEKLAKDLFRIFGVHGGLGLNALNQKLIWRNSQVGYAYYIILLEGS